MKTCSRCHVAKATEHFPVRGRLDHRNRCRPCNSAWAKKRRLQTNDRHLQYLYNACRQRQKNRYKDELITLERFKAIYLAQGGVCVETGVPFDLQSKDLMPSPDRIDNDAGYVDGNIRFVTWRINNMRNNMSTARFQSTCMEVVDPNASIPVVMADNMARLKNTYSKCKERHKKKKYESELITFERFNAIYQAQSGVCADTGVPFDWASDLMPSPDRIDNEVGYVDGNIRFVTWRVNNMRGGLSVEDFHATCTQLIHHNKRKFDAASALLMLRG